MRMYDIFTYVIIYYPGRIRPKLGSLSLCIWELTDEKFALVSSSALRPYDKKSEGGKAQLRFPPLPFQGETGRGGGGGGRGLIKREWKGNSPSSPSSLHQSTKEKFTKHSKEIFQKLRRLSYYSHTYGMSKIRLHGQGPLDSVL